MSRVKYLRCYNSWFEKKIKKPRNPRLALEQAAPLYYLITTYHVMIALFQTIFPFCSSFICRILFIIKYKIRENAMIAIYVPIPKDTRNTTKIPKSATSKDVQIDTKLILVQASLDTYPLIWNAWQLWQWSSAIKYAPQNGHFLSFVIIYFKSRHNSNRSSTTFLASAINNRMYFIFLFYCLNSLNNYEIAVWFYFI